MSYCITEVRHKAFPDVTRVTAALAPLGITPDDIIGSFTGFICSLAASSTRSFHVELANYLKSHLELVLGRDGLRPTRQVHDLAYSRTLKAHADFGLVHVPTNKRILFQVEFGTGVEKDLIHFQVGANEDIIAAAVLIAPIDRATAGTALVGIADYDSVVRLVTAVRPSYPLLVVGLRGSPAA
jgi:hypothetical protein